MLSLWLEGRRISRWKYELASIKAELKYRKLLRTAIKANFNIHQLRDPLGRWTREDGVQVTTSLGFLTGIQAIDDTSAALSDTLMRTMSTVERLPTMSPGVYGTVVHAAFGVAVRLRDIPGVGDIERSFSLDAVDPYYGMAGTIRTDVTLRNVQGDIIAIYDVKTGDRPMSRGRADELRAKTRAAPNTPVFELNVVRGISRKHAMVRILKPWATASLNIRRH